jgi:AraC family transcriptional activator of pobA
MPDAPPLLIRSFPSLMVRKLAFSGAARPARTPCFSVYLLEQGSGSVQVDHATYDFTSPALLCLSPYQRVVFNAKSKVSGWRLQFHANFFCIETHHHAVGCNGVLFNELYEVPWVVLNADSFAGFQRHLMEMDAELRKREVAHLEVLISSLKIFLIKGTRLKLAQHGPDDLAATQRPEILRRLRELLEARYTEIHSPSEYARLLGVSPKTLAPLVKAHFHKTLSELVRDRIMKHARWQLLHTLKPVKEIAFELGFEDEFYFSRLFKRTLGRAPLLFREQETEIRGAANLSM